MTTTELATIAGIAIVVILALVVLALCRAASNEPPPPCTWPPAPPDLGAPPQPQEPSAAYWREAYYAKEAYADGLRQKLNQREAALTRYRRAAIFAAATVHSGGDYVQQFDHLRRLLIEAQEAEG